MYVYIYPHDSNASNVLGEDPPGGSGPVGAPERAYLADKKSFVFFVDNLDLTVVVDLSEHVAIQLF